MKQIEINVDIVKLLKKTQGACCQMDTNASIYNSLDETKNRYYTYRQQPEGGNEIHLKYFKSNSDVAEHYNWNLYNYPGLIQYEKDKDLKTKRTRTDNEYREIVKEKMMGTAL